MCVFFSELIVLNRHIIELLRSSVPPSKWAPRLTYGFFWTPPLVYYLEWRFKSWVKSQTFSTFLCSIFNSSNFCRRSWISILLASNLACSNTINSFFSLTSSRYALSSRLFWLFKLTSTSSLYCSTSCFSLSSVNCFSINSWSLSIFMKCKRLASSSYFSRKWRSYMSWSAKWLISSRSLWAADKWVERDVSASGFNKLISKYKWWKWLALFCK